MTNLRRRKAPLAAAAALALALASCARHESAEAAAPAPARRTVAVAAASRADLRSEVNLTAEFEPYQEVDVMAKVSGYIRDIKVDIGDRVAEGQSLAILEIPEMQDDLNRAAASIEEANAELAAARDELQRDQSAYDIAHLSYTRILEVSKTERGLVPQQQVDEVHERELAADAQVSAAKSRVSACEQRVHVSQAEQGRYKTMYQYAQITAPFAGVVTRRYANVGSLIQAGTASQTQAMPVVRLSQNGLLRLQLPVPESDVPMVRLGAPVDVNVTALHRTFPGVVKRFADTVDESSRTMKTEVDVPNPNLTIVPGMYAEVDLITEQHKGVVAAPVEAIDGSGDATRVFVVRPGGAVSIVPVHLGLEDAHWAEVRGGDIREGDQVVVGPRSGLREGDQVQPKLTTRQFFAEALGDSMSRFAIHTPYLIVVACLIIAILGAVSVARMPVDMFPSMNIPVVVVATFYSGMPPEQIEGDITYHLERFFTLASGIDHIESRSLNGVSIIRVYFQPSTNADIDAATIANLAVSDMKDLPPGTLPPVVLKSDASSLPVCLVTMNGDGMTDGNLKDIAQNFVRNQLASVPGASIPQPFGGPWRQIQFYVDPYKLEARQISPMDVVRALSQANVILPAGDVQIGNLDYNIYSNAQFNLQNASQYPIKMSGESPVLMSDVGQLRDAHALQYNVVHVNGQRSVYLPVMKQGGDSNTIAIVDGVRQTVGHLVDVPVAMKTGVVFDQSRFVRTAIETLLHEGGIGLFLTCVMILIFLGSFRATLAVFFSIPLSVCATFFVLQMGGSSINSMVLGGLALALSRLIDNSVVVLENIYRHLEMGDAPPVAAENGGREVALPVLASTLTTAVVFFPVTLLAGVSRFLFSAMALAVVVSLFASYFVAMTVVPLFCARFLKRHSAEHRTPRFQEAFNSGFNRLLGAYEVMVRQAVRVPATVLALFAVGFGASLLLYTRLGFAYFPQTDAGQFVITFKAPSGTRLAVTESEAARMEDLVKQIVRPDDLAIVVDNIGVDNGFSAVYTSNAAMHTGFVQVGLQPGHRIGSYEYIRRIKERLAREMPEITPFFSTGSLVDAVVSMGAPAPIDIQIAGASLDTDNRVAQSIVSKLRDGREIGDVFMPQDLDYPSLRIDVDRLHAAKLGLTEREVLTNVITSLTSNQMIAPNLWIDPRNGNNYFLTVQYPEAQIRSIQDLRSIPLHAESAGEPTRLDMIANIERIQAPTEVDHYQIRRKLDVYVRPATEDLGAAADYVQKVIAGQQIPAAVKVAVRGSAEAMHASFSSFAFGLYLSVVLLYLILVAQFRSFMDPFVILLALPPAISGVLLTLVLSGTTLNVMSLMGVVMLAGIAMSNSILIVEFAHHLRTEGRGIREAVIESCRVRLRPILMTSLATIIGLMPMALKLGEGSESYAPLARALAGGLTVSVVFTVFLVPAGFCLVYEVLDATRHPH